MNLKTWGIIVLMFWTIIIAIQNSSLAGTTSREYYRKSLEGLAGVYVDVNYVSKLLIKYGVTKERLQTDIELRLRKAKIKVLNEEEYKEAAGQPTLAIIIELINGYININITLMQYTILYRDPSKIIYSATWSHGWHGLLPYKGLKDNQSGTTYKGDVLPNLVAKQ